MAGAFQVNAFQNNAFQVTTIPSVTTGRSNPTGKVFLLDKYFQNGPNPLAGESCVMLLNVPLPFGNKAQPVLTFAKPDGTLQYGASAATYIGQQTIVGQPLQPSFQGGSYIVYTFAIGELSEIGAWQVQARVGFFNSNIFSFQVVAPPSVVA